MVSVIEKQIECFARGTESEYAFPAELTAQERKLVKSTAEKCGLSSCSFGMGSERRIHIFKLVAPATKGLKLVEYSVKNTFVDGLVTPPDSLPGPAHQSMPAGGLQEQIAVEDVALPKELGSTLLEKLDSMLSKASKMKDSPRNSQSGGSTADSESESPDPAFSIKNTFVHFETNCDENGDPRVIQSMPSGKFVESIEAEKEAVLISGKQKNRPIPFSEDLEEDTERVSLEGMLFPATPNAESLMTAFDEMPASTGAGQDVPVVQWVSPAAAAVDASITVLPPAFWNPSPAQILIDSPIAPKEPAQRQDREQPQGAGSLEGPAAQLAQQPAPLLPPGTPVVLSGLENQPKCNGLHGLVSDFDTVHSRYNVVIEIGPNAQKSVFKVKPHNLLITQSCLPAPPPYCPPAQQQMVPNRPKASLCLDQMV